MQDRLKKLVIKLGEVWMLHKRILQSYNRCKHWFLTLICPHPGISISTSLNDWRNDGSTESQTGSQAESNVESCEFRQFDQTGHQRKHSSNCSSLWCSKNFGFHAMESKALFFNGCVLFRIFCFLPLCEINFLISFTCLWSLIVRIVFWFDFVDFERPKR